MPAPKTQRRRRGYPKALADLGHEQLGVLAAEDGVNWHLFRLNLNSGWEHWKFVANGLVNGRANYLIIRDSKGRTARCDIVEMALDHPELVAFWRSAVLRREAESLC